MSKLFNWAAARLVAAFALALPLAAWAVTTTGYEDFGDTAGVVLWRGTEANFHASTVIDVAEDGTLGEPYAMTADKSATSWQRFASSITEAYTSPGKVLVYDTPGTGDGYKYNPNCTFGPLSFGGMWVKTLAINGLPFSIIGSGDRKTEFGAVGKSTLFKFDASYTIDRTGTTTFFGDATVDIAQGATFTAQANSSHVVVVDSAATLKLKGAGTFAVTTMNVNGTLDLSETTRPAINGNVVLVGTIVLPEETEVSTESPFTVCSGTLSCANAYVKIGSAEAVEKHVTVSGGAITGFGDPVYEYTENYPTVVPAGQIFTFIGGETAATATTASGVTVNGTLKTRGYISLTGLTTAKESVLEVVDGTATVTASGDQALSGDITIDAGATMVNARTADALNYGWGVYVKVYGTLVMGNTRWTVGSNAYIHLYENAQIIGAGQGSNGAIDITSDKVSVIAHGDSAISANMRVRTQDASIEVEEGKTLTISGLINDGVAYSQPGSIKKKGSGNLVLTTAPTFTKALKLEAGVLELGGTAVAADVTVTSSSATVVAAENAVLTGDLTFVAHVPSAANKALIVSDAFTGKVILNGDFGSSNYVSLSGLGNAVTLKDFTGFLNQGWDATNVKITIEGTFTQSNGWSGSDSDVTANAVYIAELLGSGTMTQNGAQKQSYIVGNIANFAGTFNFSKSRIKSNSNAVLDKAQTVATLTVANTLTVNGGSLTGNLVAKDVAVTVDGTPAVGDVLVPVTGTVSVTGTVTVNGDEVAVECVAGEGVKFVAPLVTINVPKVANTTVAVSVGGSPVSPATEGESTNTYSVVEGSTVTVTYSSDDYEVTGGTFEFAASENYTVDAAGVTTAPYVAQIKVGTGTEYEKYTSVAQALTSENVYRGITLLGNATEGTLDITQQYVMLTGAGYTLTADITVGASTTFVPYNVTLDGDITVNGIYNQMGTVAVTGDLTTGDGARLQFSTLGTDVAALTVGGDIAVNGALTLTPNSTSGLTTGVAYKTLNGATVTLAEGASVTLGTIEGAILGYVVEPNETTTLTIKIPAAKVGEDDYHDTFASARAAAAGVGVITLLKDVSSVVTNYNTQTGYITSIVTNDLVTIAADEVLKINANGYVICVGLASGLTPPVYTLSTVTDGNVATYSVVHSVASVDNELYPSIAAAVAAAEDGDTIMLLDNITLDSTVVITNSVTLDLNGNDIAATGVRALWIKSGAVSITGEGVVSANGGGLADTSSVIRVGDGATNANAASLTIGADVTIASATCYGVTAFGKNTPGITLVVNGTVSVTGTASAISGNGSSGLASAYITVNEGATVSAMTDAGIYFPGTGTLDITGGTITGPTAVYVKCGTVNISGGMLTGTADKSDYAYNGNGLNATGDALVIDTCGYPGNPASVSVTGGTFTSQNADAVASYKKSDDEKYAGDTENEAATGFVSGGTFNTVVEETYCAEGYEPKDNGDGTYGVRADKGWIFAAEGNWDYTGTWSGIASAGEKVTIETNATYTATKESAGQLVTIEMNVSFESPCTDDESLGDAKAAIRLAGESESYVFQLYTTNELGEAAWANATAASVTPTIGVDYALIFVLDLTNKVYTASIVDGATTNALCIGESVAEIPFAYQGNVTPVQQIEFIGSGTVTSIAGSYETPIAPEPQDFMPGDDVTIDGGSVNLTAEQATWLNACGEKAVVEGILVGLDTTAFNNAYLLNLDITDPKYDGTFSFEVTNFTVADASVTVEVTLTRKGKLDGGINGTLKLTGTADLATGFGEISVTPVGDDDFSEGDTATWTLSKGTDKFFQPVIE